MLYPSHRCAPSRCDDSNVLAHLRVLSRPLRLSLAKARTGDGLASSVLQRINVFVSRPSEYPACLTIYLPTLSQPVELREEAAARVSRRTAFTRLSSIPFLHDVNSLILPTFSSEDDNARCVERLRRAISISTGGMKLGCSVSKLEGRVSAARWSSDAACRARVMIRPQTRMFER